MKGISFDESCDCPKCTGLMGIDKMAGEMICIDCEHHFSVRGFKEDQNG